MKKLCLLSFLFLSCTILSAQKSNTSKPNILFIAIDDLKPLIGAYGNQIVQTPNIDRLAKRGTTFLNNYCQQAVCGPTRASILTGMRPDYTKIWDLKTQLRAVSPSIVTLPQYLQTQGYTTLGIGKVFDPRNVDADFDKVSWSVPYYKTEKKYYAVGFGEPALGRYQDANTKQLAEQVINDALAAGKTKAEAKEEANIKVKPATESASVPDNAYTDGANVLQAIHILSEVEKNKEPFFFAVGISKPHLPFVAPKKYWDLYDRNQIQIAPFQDKISHPIEVAYHNVGELRSYTDMPQVISATAQKDFGLTLSVEKQKELLHGYYASVSYTDAMVGKLLDAIDSLGLAKNTIIVLWGDHGWHLGDHNLWCKHSNFEEATKAPLIVSDPRIKSNKTKSISEHVDIFPTICDLSGVPIPANLQGKSLKPIMLDSLSTVKKYAVSQYPRSGGVAESERLGFAAANVMGYSIRNERYRYTMWLNNSFRSTEPFNEAQIIGIELYDYQLDPLEKNNVANQKEYVGVSAEIKKEMIQYFATQVINN
ncbi:MAG: hypothetical protein RJB67_133 [Bacteroidota bacterium]|jgi:arylsulfatase A-like enzyme